MTVLETLWVDSRNAPTATSAMVLTAGVPYLLEIVGNLTYHDKPVDMGDPDPILYPSPGAAASMTLAESDYETVYAWPSTHAFPPPSPLPHHHTRFEIDLGSGWAHIEPRGGPFSSPSAGRRYVLDVTGEGSPIRFRLVDSPYSDNSGRLRLTIAPAGDPGWGIGFIPIGGSS